TVDVIVQENTKSYMERMDPVYTSQPTGQQENIFKKNDGRGLPKRTFKDTWTMGSGDDQIDLRYFGPAHTGGDAYVIFTKYRGMHGGDTVPTPHSRSANHGQEQRRFGSELLGHARQGRQREERRHDHQRP